MSAQFAEHLLNNEKVYELWTLPLEPYLDQSNKRSVLENFHRHTACFRGYVGVWEIKERQLFLNELLDVNGKNIPLGLLFETDNEPIFAEWFSGELRCPRGQLLRYVHFEFASVYRQERRIPVIKGIVGTEYVITNPDPPPRAPSEESDVPEFLRKPSA